MIICSKCGEEKPRAKKHTRICRACLTEYNRQYRAAHPTHSRDSTRKWRAENRERDRQSRREWQAKRRANPVARICDTVSSAVAKALYRVGAKKNARAAAIIGYDPRAIARWALANGYGAGKHIDHIIPLAYFLRRHPDDPEYALRCAWQLGNLRVVSAAENLTKGAKRVFLC